MATITTPVAIKQLECLADGVWILNGSMTMGGGSMLEIPLRMTILKMGEGELLVVSPLPPSPEVTSQLKQLEEEEGCKITKVLAPNVMHHTWARPFVAAWPGSALYATVGLKRRFPTEEWGTLLGEGGVNRKVATEQQQQQQQEEEEVTDELKDVKQGGGSNSSNSNIHNTRKMESAMAMRDVFGPNVIWRHMDGCASLSEIVLLHKPTKTLVLADLAFGLSDRGIKAFGWVFRLFYFPLMGMRQGRQGRRAMGDRRGTSFLSYRRCCVTRIFAFMTDVEIDADDVTSLGESCRHNSNGNTNNHTENDDVDVAINDGEGDSKGVTAKVTSSQRKDGSGNRSNSGGGGGGGGVKKGFVLLNELEKLLSDWDFDKVIMAHGECIREGGKEQFELGTVRFFREMGSIKLTFVLSVVAIVGGLTACLGAGVMELWRRRR